MNHIWYSSGMTLRRHLRESWAEDSHGLGRVTAPVHRQQLLVVPGLIPSTSGVAHTMPGLNHHAVGMAPIKQKRRARNGAVTVPVEVQMPPVLRDDFDGAAKASGVSRSLYFELLAQQLRDSTGRLPVLAPTFDIDQEAHISAA